MLQDGDRWEHFSHDADVGIRGRSKTLERAFEMAGQALVSVITNLNKIEASESLKIECQASDLDLLFYDWVNALVFEIDTRRMIFSQFKVTIHDNYLLQAEVRGEKINSKKHDLVVEIKGATMTELRVEKINDEWIAQCVVDV